jgi:hypothetical protein
MSFLIHIPGCARLDLAAFEQLGLGDLVGGDVPAIMTAVPGPEGLGAMAMYGDPIQLPPMKYLPDQQTWRPARPDPARCLPAARFFLGKYDTKPIDPQSLKRAKQWPGEFVTLSDGKQWLIPTARQLPHVWGLGDDGEFLKRPKHDFKAFCDKSESLFAHFLYDLPEDLTPENPTAITFRDGFVFACQALALNYHVDREVVDFLDLLDDETGSALIKASLEFELIMRTMNEKKNVMV